MERILEPEIMADKYQVIAYAKANFSQSNQWYVDHLIDDFADRLRYVIDIGCGPADVVIRLARANHNVHITAIDGSEEMIKLAKQAVMAAGFENQITTIHGYVPGLRLERNYDAVLSKDLLHHLPDPTVFWSEAKRLAKPEGVIYVMDLFRPETQEEARRIVESIAANEDAILKEDFYNSLCAAFTIKEVEQQLRHASLTLRVVKVSERHMLISGLLP